MSAHCYNPLRLIASLALLLSCLQHSSGDLIQVYTINRHGARNVLRKDANLTESDANGGPTLLPTGRTMTNAAGAAFRQRYIDPSTCRSTCLGVASNGTLYGVFGTPGTGFTNYNTVVGRAACWLATGNLSSHAQVRSSGLDRAILSANGFMTGVFPPVNASSNTTSYVTAQVHQSHILNVAPTHTQPSPSAGTRVQHPRRRRRVYPRLHALPNLSKAPGRMVQQLRIPGQGS